MAEDTYKGKAWCSNCGEEVSVDIPKGATRKEYLEEDRMCPICGCMSCGLPKEE